MEAELRLGTASGALMPGMGFLTRNIQIGSEYYRQKFIVCKQLTPGIILGWDLLSRNQLGITWGPEGILQLRDSQDIPVQTMEEMTTYTARLIANIVIPSRSLMAVPVRIVLPSCESQIRFDFTPIQEDSCLGPNCVIYPLDYATIKGGPQRRLQVILNLSYHEVKLQEGLILGHFQRPPDEEIMITKEDIFGINVMEPLAPEEIEEEVLKGDG